MDNVYMKRALELARNGAGFVSPNPMVGAVIVTPDNRIIGEGWHALYGGPHAEVNAIASVRPEHRELLKESTIYVTLEPCSHYGKTPPCSKLIIETGLKRVVVGMTDPFKEVSGRGIAMLRDAGIEVEVNVMEEECSALNRRFITAHKLHRPYIQLKWAESADGFIGGFDTDGSRCPIRISTPESLVEMHRERAMVDAIMVGSGTLVSDNPSLTTRLWPARKSPRPVIFNSPRLSPDLKVMQSSPIILDPVLPLTENMHLLYSEHKITSLMVEGGAELLQSFIDAELYDEVRIEKSGKNVIKGVKAPVFKG